MKKVLATVAEWFAIVGVLCALIGFIFPPAGMWRLDESGAKDWDWLTLGKLMSSDGNALVIVALIVMILALLATFYLAVVFKVTKKPANGLLVFGAVVVGLLCAFFIRNTLIVNAENAKDSLGVYIIGVAFLLQAVGALLAVITSFMKDVSAEKAE